MKAADTSLVVAAFASWHEHHERARRLLDGGLRLIEHCALETASVLPWIGNASFAGRVDSCENRRMRPSQALASQRHRVLALAAARGASDVRVFGSVARGVDHDGSDIDLLVDLPMGTSLLHIIGLQLDIEDALGVKVDLCTEPNCIPS